MAKSKQDKSADKDAAEDKVPEAETMTPDAPADTPETVAAASDTPETIAAEPDTLAPRTETVDADETPKDADPAEDRPDSVPHDGVDVASSEADDTLAPEPTPEPAPAVAAAPPEPKVIRETVVERKGGFVPMLLGGVVAAGIGYVAGAYPDLPFMGPQEVVEDPFVTTTNAALRTQADAIAALTGRADEAAAAIAAIDLAPISASVTQVQGTLDDVGASVDGLETALGAMSDRVAALDARLTEVEKQPLKDAVSPETIAAYEREIETLKSDVAAQQAAVAAAQQAQLETIEAARAEIEAIATRAREAEASATDRAALAASRAALADLTTRARDGLPYAEPLAVLSANGVSVPAPLAEAAAEGLPTTAVLISSFPDAARDALTAARAAGEAGEDPGSVSGFLQRQLGARSVTPRDGDDPDAVLSRAEAALRGGDLDTTLSEIASLPEAAQTELSDWVAQAQQRRDALAAAAELAQELNQE